MNLYNDASLIITPNGYKAGKLYALKGDDLNVVRATTATRVNSSGLIESVSANVPRLDYSNGSCPSILVEPQRTNLLTYSEQFDDASWIKSNATISANTTTAPDGTLTADKIIEDNSNSAHFTVKSFFYTGSNTLSIFLKKAERDKVIIQLANSTGVFYAKLVDLTNGTLLPPPAPFTNIPNSSIEDFGNGWYRVDITLNDIILEAAFFLYNGSSYIYTGDGASGFYLWGVQLEAGEYATSYIPTTASAVTRNADVISKTGISSLIGQTEGTIFFDFNYTQNSESSIVSIFNTSVSNLILFETFNNILYLTIITSGVLVCQIPFTTITNQNYKIAVGYKLNDIVFYVNGSQAGVDTSATIPATNEINLGFLRSIFAQQKTDINSVVLWKTRLTNAQLAELTTI